MAEQEKQPEFVDGSKGKHYDREASITESFAGTRVPLNATVEVEGTPGINEVAQILWDEAKDMNRDWWKQQ